ncbi:hypothetical protein CRYUN_Cryun05aG0272900 [Craigia yunnanensis]
MNASLQTLVLSDTNFGGQVPESIGNLGQLTRLELARCNFSGPIPESMLKLTQLVYLDFSSNNFSGPMPSFSSSRNLTQLNLAHNQLNGTIHSTKWSGFSKLASIDLRNNRFSGTIPPTLFRIPSLQKILLSQNQFSGNLSNLHCEASLLDTLDLSSNKLQGPLPGSVCELQGLKLLSLSSNNFSGFIQLKDIQNLRNLSSLDLSHNQLSINSSATNPSLPSFSNITTLKLASCNLVKFPDFLKNQSRLVYLDLSYNNIHGVIPKWIWEARSLLHLNLSQNFLVESEEPLQNITSSLRVLDLHGNQLQGKIPFFPQYASYLDYSNNNFGSVIPAGIGDYLQFTYFFSLSGNNFHGSIPGSICNSLYLQVLDLSNNSLSGRIPQCLTQMNVSLGVLNLRRNNLSGIISDSFPENCRLQTLDLNRNRVKGKVPQSLANCKKLEVLDIGNNQINGTFPCHLKNISTLRVIVLQANKFNGSIHCPGKKSSWPMLQIVDLASNNFSVTVKGLELEMLKILTVFTSIDISCNNFEGPIPEMIAKFNALYVLNFSHNAFEGSIPPFLGNLRQLESLDLTTSGTDPNKHPASVISEASFENNTGLCGRPLSVLCPNVPSQAPHTVPEFRSRDGFDWQFIFIGLGFGVVAAAFVAPLIFWKRVSNWVDDNVDKILEVIPPKVGLTYTRPDDAKVEETLKKTTRKVMMKTKKARVIM